MARSTDQVEGGTALTARQAWRKLGQIFAPDGSKAWMASHAANPIAEPLGGSEVRIYFSSRDAENRSSIGSIDISMDEPSRALNTLPFGWRVSLKPKSLQNRRHASRSATPNVTCSRSRSRVRS